jgi:hypothetical protein
MKRNSRIASASGAKESSIIVAGHPFSIAEREIILIQGNWYVSHAGLLRLAQDQSCNGIHTEIISPLSEPSVARWVVRATVFKTSCSKGFVGYGDADPSNVSPLVRGAELRVAETRAVNRALRKAYGIGLCSVEEIGTHTEEVLSRRNGHGKENGDDDQHPSRVRDRLLLLIRQHGLDATQVKRFAEAFCGNKPLRQAERAEVEAFVDHLSGLVSQGTERVREVLERYASAPGESGETADQAKEKEAA